MEQEAPPSNAIPFQPTTQHTPIGVGDIPDRNVAMCTDRDARNDNPDPIQSAYPIRFRRVYKDVFLAHLSKLAFSRDK